MCFGIIDRELAEVKDACGQHGIRRSRLQYIREMVESSGPAACYDWNMHGVADSAGEFEIVAIACAVGIHAC